MSETALVVLVWIVGVIGVAIMKKLQPENKIYPIWVAIVCILLTAWVEYLKSWM